MSKFIFGLLVAIAAIIGAGPVRAQTSANPIFIDKRAGSAESAGRQAATAALAEKATARGQVRVILGLNVQLSDEDSIGVAEATAQKRRLSTAQAGVSQRTGLGSSRVTRFETIPYMSAFVNAQQLERLLADPDVISIQEDIPLAPLLAQSVPLIKANKAWQAGFTGRGQVVAVLDTGSEDTHPMLTGKLVAGFCRSTTDAGQDVQSVCPGGVESTNHKLSGRPCSAAVKGCNHGTHVASIAVGKSSTLRGVARDAKLIAGQVFSRFNDAGDCASSGGAPCALTFFTDVTAGLERVFQLRNTHQIAAVNMSLGGGQFSAACDASVPALTDIINKLTAARIAVVISSGNSFFDGFIGIPACISKAVAVGSTTKADAISGFSNHSALVDLLAPGESINAAAVGGGFVAFSGTSMAAPHVAGTFAILKQASPSSSVSVITASLRSTGKSVARAGVTKRRINVEAALADLVP